MAVRNKDFPPRVLRAHRPRTADALQQPDSDVQQEVYTEDLPRQRGVLVRHLPHILTSIGLMVGFYLLLTQLVFPFIANTRQHWDYGQARVSVVDLNVGHNGMSHFVAEYYKQQIIIIEIPVSHPEKSAIYTVFQAANGDTQQHVVTLSTAYISRNAVQGKPDLIVSVSGFAVNVVLYNTGTAFRTGE